MAGGGGGLAPQPKQEELQPHPAKDQLPSIAYCITSPPPWPEAILLGFQHYLVMLGTTVLIPTHLVPQMGGGNEEKAKMIQTLLFVAGLNTLFQSFFGTRLPAVIVISKSVNIIIKQTYNICGQLQLDFLYKTFLEHPFQISHWDVHIDIYNHNTDLVNFHQIQSQVYENGISRVVCLYQQVNDV